MSVLFFAGARTPTRPVIQATGASPSTIGIALTLPSVEPSSGIAFYRLYRAVGSGKFVQIAQPLPSQFPYLDTAVVSGNTYSYRVVAVNNALNQDSSAPSATSAASVTSGSIPVNLIKFHPGHYMLSANVNGQPTAAAGNGRNQSEMTILGTHGVGIQGYIAQYDWTALEGATLGSYQFGVGAAIDKLGADFSALQATPGCNGKRYGILVRTFHDPISITSLNIGNAWTSNSPAYILNDTTSTYGALGPNGTQRGYVLSQNAPVSGAYDFQVSFAAKHVPGVTTRYIALFQGIANGIVPTCTINGVVYAGYTYDNHPYIEIIGDWDEFSISYSPPAIPPDYTAAGEAAQWGRLYQGMAAAFPHTIATGYPSYGNATGTTTQIPNLLGVINAGVAAKNFFLSNSDTYPNWTVFGAGITSQQLYAGNSYANPNNESTGLISGGNPDLRETMGYIGTAQSADYSTSPSAAAITSIYNIMIGNTTGTPGSTTNFNKGLNATHMVWSTITNESTPNWWQNFIYPTISPGGIPLPTNTTPPSNIAGRTIST